MELVFAIGVMAMDVACASELGFVRHVKGMAVLLLGLRNLFQAWIAVLFIVIHAMEQGNVRVAQDGEKEEIDTVVSCTIVKNAMERENARFVTVRELIALFVDRNYGSLMPKNGVSAMKRRNFKNSAFFVGQNIKTTLAFGLCFERKI